MQSSHQKHVERCNKHPGRSRIFIRFPILILAIIPIVFIIFLKLPSITDKKKGDISEEKKGGDLSDLLDLQTTGEGSGSEHQYIPGYSFVIMGVSSTGKTVIGQQLSHSIGAKFIDGDDLHPRENILKMESGEALNDGDRKPWLERIREAIFSIERAGEVGVVVCSALKRAYRDILREGNEKIRFIHLHGEFNLIAERMQARTGHFMPISLLESQFNTLEMPESDESDVVVVSVEGSINVVLARVIDAMQEFQLK